MLRQKNFIKTVECRIGRSDLRNDVRTVTILLHHSLDAADLSLDTAEPVGKAGDLLR